MGPSNEGAGAPTGEVGQMPIFVLSGGGNLGAHAVRMLYALVESGVRLGMIGGSSRRCQKCLDSQHTARTSGSTKL